MLGEPRLAPSTLDHLTVPLMTRVPLSAGAQTQCDARQHTHTDSQPSTHRDAVTRVFPLFFSIYHSVAESANIGLWAV